MSGGESEVLVQAERLADALAAAKDGMSLNEYLLMLIEMNMKIEEITKIDYGSICAPYSDYNCI
jgi:hypothetical protein